MDKDAAKFIVREYLGLWEDLGIEELNPRLSEGLRRNQASRSPGATAPTPPQTLEEIQTRLGNCARCSLSRGRNRIVFGSGNPRAKLIFVGESPGNEEDLQGLPYVGEAGQLLSKIIEAMGYTRDEVYLVTLLKCRVSPGKVAGEAEIESCSPFLHEQINVIHPRLIVTLGALATAALTGSPHPFSSLRGKFQRLRGPVEGFVMPTYPPDYLLQNPTSKRVVWEDMKLVRAKLENFQ